MADNSSTSQPSPKSVRWSVPQPFCSADNSSTSQPSPKSVRWSVPQPTWSAASVDLGTEHGYLRRTTDCIVRNPEKNPPIKRPMAIHERDKPWEKKNLLTLDGGGIRGISTLLVLRALMDEIGKVERAENLEARSSAYSPFVDCSTEEDYDPFPSSTSDDKALERKRSAYRPCHYFDYIGGSSSGGLIALMLGRLRMSVDDALISYKKLSDRIIDLSLFRLALYRMGFKNEALKEHYERVIKALHPFFPSPHELGKEFKSDSTRCKTIVCSIQSSQDKRHKEPVLFRSYNQNIEIWEVARATGAAPFYFEPVALGDELYYDAASFFHNPSRYVLDEVRSEAHGGPDTVAVLVSIGAGNFESKGISRRGSNTSKSERTHVSDPIHESLEHDSKHQQFDYYRLNVDDHLRTGRLNDWISKGNGRKTLQQIVEASTKHLEAQPVREQIHQIAKRLVSIRLRRAETMRWERFATGIVYHCPINDCPLTKSRFEDRGDLMDHLRGMHDKPPPDIVNNQEIQALLDKGRTNSG